MAVPSQILMIAFYGILFSWNETAIAQPQPAPTITATPSSAQAELERLREEKRIEALVKENLRDSPIVRDQVIQEVDRAFNRNTTLLNLLLSLLTLLPVLIAVGFLLLRRSVINEIVAETKRQLQQEVQRQMEEEVAEELKEQMTKFRQQVDGLQAEFISQLSQLQTLFLDAQREKQEIFEEISRILSTSIQKEFVSPAVQQEIQDLTKQLESLKSANFQLIYTADDYVREGDAFYYEGRYTDAIASYNQALEIELALFPAWRGKARTLRRLKQYEEALNCTEEAMRLKPEDGLNWFERGYILQSLQRYEVALEAYNRSIQLKSDYHRAWNHRGYVLLKLERYEDGFADLQRGKALKSDYGNPYYGTAYYYVLNNQFDLAIEQLKQAIYFYPKYREVLETDADFDPIRTDDRFKRLFES